MNFVNQIWQDLRNKRLLPLAAVLLVAIVAVPVVLTSSSTPPATPPVAPPPSVTKGLPAVSDTSAPSTAAPSGRARNPFAAAGGQAASSTTTTTTRTTTPLPSQPSSSNSGGTGGSTSGGTTPTTPPTTTTPQGGQSPGQPPIPTPKPKHTVPVLGPEQSYSVTLAITNHAGGLDTINPLERLSPLPQATQPLVVELGVLKGGSRVLFAVQPGTKVSGKGTCIPGPIDCEILSLAQAQTERLSVQTKNGAVPVAMFAVTAINVVHHSSHSAAMKVRDRESGIGRRVLSHSSLNALSLFRYELGTGAVADLRNLTLRNN